MTTTAHVAGEGYSGHNPVPTIQKYQGTYIPVNRASSPFPLITCATDQLDAEGDADQNKSLPPTPAVPSGDNLKKDEKRELMERMQPPKGTKPIDAAKQKGDKWVTDPVTGQQVLLKNPQMNGEYRSHSMFLDYSLSLVSSLLDEPRRSHLCIVF